MPTIAAQGYSFEVEALPESTRLRLMQGGLNHVLGSEVSAVVTSRGRAHLVKSFNETNAGVEGFVPAKPDSFTKDDLKALREEETALWSGWVREALAEKVKMIEGGTLGVARVRAEPVDPVEALAISITRGEITTKLRNANIKVPKGEETVETPQGIFTMDELIERRLTLEGDRIRKEAQRQVAAKSKATANGLADL
jgi:hypothetical protein